MVDILKDYVKEEARGDDQNEHAGLCLTDLVSVVILTTRYSISRFDDERQAALVGGEEGVWEAVGGVAGASLGVGSLLGSMNPIATLSSRFLGL